VGKEMEGVWLFVVKLLLILPDETKLLKYEKDNFTFSSYSNYIQWLFPINLYQSDL
jgi:hypothetical protein